MKSALTDVLDRLKSEGFRLTGTRRKLVTYILQRKGHWTIQELAHETKRAVPGVGVATVYRTVGLLHDLKLLTETQFGAAAPRYEVAPSHHHDHLSCVNCGMIFEFEKEEIEELQRKVARQLGFELIDHRMELYGECIRASCPNRHTHRSVHPPKRALPPPSAPSKKRR